MHCSLFLKESLILRRDDSLQFVAFINKKLYTKRKILVIPFLVITFIC